MGWVFFQQWEASGPVFSNLNPNSRALSLCSRPKTSRSLLALASRHQLLPMDTTSSCKSQQGKTHTGGGFRVLVLLLAAGKPKQKCKRKGKREKKMQKGEKKKKKFYFACCFGYLLHSTLQNAVKFILTVAMQFFFLESKEWHLGITTFFSLIMFHSEITDFW